MRGGDYWLRLLLAEYFLICKILVINARDVHAVANCIGYVFIGSIAHLVYWFEFQFICTGSATTYNIPLTIFAAVLT